MANSIQSDVIAIICEQLDVTDDQATPSSSFTDDLGADSLAIVELVLALEEKFGVKIPDEEVDRIRTVGDAIKYIEAHTASAS
ncbi:MAG: acyl carrier protein [Myxococcales bacterium]|nr:acyl carrier protein [Myxococcales bacterium]MCB9752781.1 acyl carrier protein [Myxococcales bacterium]